MWKMQSTLYVFLTAYAWWVNQKKKGWDCAAASGSLEQPELTLLAPSYLASGIGVQKVLPDNLMTPSYIFGICYRVCGFRMSITEKSWL